MIIVLDASAGIEIALTRKNFKNYMELLEKASKIITSDLYRAETANVLWKYCKADLITKKQAFQRLRFCDNLIDEYCSISLNNEEALGEGIRLNHSIYDLLYLTLARRNGAVLLTQDKTLKEIATQQGIDTY